MQMIRDALFKGKHTLLLILLVKTMFDRGRHITVKNGEKAFHSGLTTFYANSFSLLTTFSFTVNSFALSGLNRYCAVLNTSSFPRATIPFYAELVSARRESLAITRLRGHELECFHVVNLFVNVMPVNRFLCTTTNTSSSQEGMLEIRTDIYEIGFTI